MNANSSIPATPAKLRNGSWGARVANPSVRVGDVVHIRTQSGKEWDAKVAKVLWTGDGVALCETVRLDYQDPPTPGGYRPRRRVGYRDGSRWCNCGACDDLLSLGYRAGQVITCPECGRKAEAC